MVVTCFEGAGWKLLFLPCLLWGCLPAWGDFWFMVSFLVTQGVLSIYENIKGCVTFMTFLLMIWTKKAIMNWYRTQCLEREFFLKLIYLLGTAVISVSVVPYIWFPLYEFYDCVAERIMPASIARIMKQFRDFFFLITSLLLAVHCLSQTDLFRRVRPMKPPNPNAPLLPRNMMKTLKMVLRVFSKLFKLILRTTIGFYKVTMRTLKDCPVVGNYAPAPLGAGFVPMMGESCISVDDDGTGTFLSNLWKTFLDSWLGPNRRAEVGHSKKKPTKRPRGDLPINDDDSDADDNLPGEAQPVNQRKGRGRGRPNRVVMEANYRPQRKTGGYTTKKNPSPCCPPIKDEEEEQEQTGGWIAVVRNAVKKFFSENDSDTADAADDNNNGGGTDGQEKEDTSLPIQYEDALRSSDSEDGESIASIPRRDNRPFVHRYMTRSQAQLHRT